MEKSKVELLRKAKAEDLKPGVGVVHYHDGDEGKVIAGPDKFGCYSLELDKDGFCTTALYYICLAPRGWIQDKPVYDGDRVYGLNNRLWGTAKEDGILWDGATYTQSWGNRATSTDCAWEGPNKPLCYLDGKPVFKGTKLFRRMRGGDIVEVVADHIERARYEENEFLFFENPVHGSCFADNRLGTLSWERPKETKTAYTLVFKAQTFDTAEEAEKRRKGWVKQLGGNAAEQIFVGTATWTE